MSKIYLEFTIDSYGTSQSSTNIAFYCSDIYYVI